jgi:RND family efflux transporter MFP subunit
VAESSNLKGDLASLKIDREAPASSAWRWPLLFFVPVILGLLAIYTLRIRAALATVEVETVQPTVLRSAAATSTETPILTASGYVVARRKAVVSAKIQGRLSELRVEEGSRVEKGEVFAKLESADYEAQVAKTRAALLHARADLAENERLLHLDEKLIQDKVISQDTLDAARSKVRLSEADVAQAEADLGFAEATLQNCLIRAPFAGVVVKKMAEVGESVAPIPPGVNISTSSGAIVALADLDTLEVEADVSESNVAKLKAAQPAEVTVEAIPDKKFKAVVRLLIPTADRTKATVLVKVTILDKDKDLRPEMSAKVTFFEKAQPPQEGATAAPVVTVPSSAAVNRDGRTVVYEVRDGRVVARTVVTADEHDGVRVVKEGLSGGEILVARPAETLKDGDRVKVKQ